MQPALGSRRLARVGTSWLVVVALALAGCSFAPDLSVPGTGPLLIVQMRGGMCPEGMCDSTVTLQRDGTVHSAAKPPNELGRVARDAYRALETAVGTADFAAMRAKKFTGVCPAAFDGVELVFTFSVGATTERLASCETDIDWGTPLFIALAAALGEWVQLPRF